MDVRLSPEQQALADAARSMTARLGVVSVRDLEDDERAAKLDAALEASGWRELRAAADDSGDPLGSGVEVALVAEQLGAALADAPFLGPTLAADLRRRAGAAPADGPETVLLTGDLGGLARQPSGIAIDARCAGTALAVDGSGALVAVGFEPVASNAAGGFGPDLSRPSADVPAGSPVFELQCKRPLREADLQSLAALALAAACADLVGAMRAGIALAVGYVSARRQYGVAVGSFQALQHLLADAHVAAEGSASAALHAAWAVDALEPAAALAATSAAKAYCARSGVSVAETVIQAHGGIGNTWECPAHLYLRRCLLSADLFGGVGPCLDRVMAHRTDGTQNRW